MKKSQLFFEEYPKFVKKCEKEELDWKKSVYFMHAVEILSILFEWADRRKKNDSRTAKTNDSACHTEERVF